MATHQVPYYQLADNYTQILMMSENLFAQGCSSCHCDHNDDSNDLYQCDDCICSRPVCPRCLIRDHQIHPLHNIKRWDKVHRCFLPHSLCDVGLIIEIIHTDYSACPSRSQPTTLTVMHTNGVHRVAIRYCECAEWKLQPDTQHRLEGPTVCTTD